MVVRFRVWPLGLKGYNWKPLYGSAFTSCTEEAIWGPIHVEPILGDSMGPSYTLNP